MLNRILLAVIAAVAVFAQPATADALTFKGKRTGTGHFFLGGCGDTDSDYLWTLKDRPHGFRAIRPLLGELVFDEETGRAVGHVTDISVRRDSLYWTLTGSHFLCSPEADRFDYGSGSYRMAMAFKYVDRVRNSEAKHELKRFLKNRWPFYKYSSWTKTRCRGKEPRWRCNIIFGAGDVGYEGKAKIRVRRHRGRAQFVIRYRLRKTNYYCIYGNDNPRSECTRTIRGKVKR